MWLIVIGAVVLAADGFNRLNSQPNQAITEIGIALFAGLALFVALAYFSRDEHR